MTVIINKNHCEKSAKNHGGDVSLAYSNNGGCPLFLAIKEQYPNFPLNSVAGSYVSLTDRTKRSITNWEDWNHDTMQKIIDGEIENFVIILS